MNVNKRKERIQVSLKFSREFERKVAVKSEFTGSKLPNSRENFKTRWQVAAGKG